MFTIKECKKAAGMLTCSLHDRNAWEVASGYAAVAADFPATRPQLSAPCRQVPEPG